MYVQCCHELGEISYYIFWRKAVASFKAHTILVSFLLSFLQPNRLKKLQNHDVLLDANPPNTVQLISGGGKLKAPFLSHRKSDLTPFRHRLRSRAVPCRYVKQCISAFLSCVPLLTTMYTRLDWQRHALWCCAWRYVCFSKCIGRFGSYPSCRSEQQQQRSFVDCEELYGRPIE